MCSITGDNARACGIHGQKYRIMRLFTAQPAQMFYTVAALPGLTLLLYSCSTRLVGLAQRFDVFYNWRQRPRVRYSWPKVPHNAPVYRTTSTNVLHRNSAAWPNPTVIL